MTRPQLRFRKEPFGYTLAFDSGHVGFYSNKVGPVLLTEPTFEEVEKFRLEEMPVTDNFHLSAPLIVWFEITRSCNLPCRHCYVSAGQPREGELTTSQIFNILDQLKEKGVFALVLVGGEPLTHPDFVPILKHAHELGFVISIATNGTHITQELIDQLPREECVMSVSLDGTTFQKEFRVKTTYDEIRGRLQLLKQNQIPTAIMTTLTSVNVAELEEVYEFAKENDFFFGTTPFSPIGRGRLFPQYQPNEDVVEQASQLFVKEVTLEDEQMSRPGLYVARFLYLSYQLSRAIKHEFCGISLAYILSDGSVYPCSVCASTNKYPAGNLKEKSFADIWENCFHDIRSVSFADFKGCDTCELSAPEYFCTSRCPVMSEIYTGDPFQCGSTPYLKLGLKRKTELLSDYDVNAGQTSLAP